MTKPSRFDALGFLANLCEGGRAADDAARALIAHYRPFLERRLRGRGANPHDAEDLATEVLFNVVTRAHEVRAPGAFHSWLVTIADNQLKAHWRAQGQERQVMVETPAHTEEDQIDLLACMPDPHALDVGARLCLQGQLEKFIREQPQRFAALEHEFHGHDHREIAQLIGRSYGASRQFVSQCFAKLLDYFRPCISDELAASLRQAGGG
jgi:RNA polymerase sigma-70 factor (ECF subfamily)